jgi:RimJ/RimL family protein N-acetyltransferase
MEQRSDNALNDLATFTRRVVIRDGRTVEIRAIRPDDRHDLLEGFKHLSKESIYYRFLGPRRELSERELSYYTELDFIHHVGLVAIMSVGGKSTPVAVGRYVEKLESQPVRIADLAFVVGDEFHNLGIGTVLFEQIVVFAQQNGIERLEADVLLQNSRMLEVLEHSGFKLEKHVSNGIAHIEFNIAGKSFKKYYI